MYKYFVYNSHVHYIERKVAICTLITNLLLVWMAANTKHHKL